MLGKAKIDGKGKPLAWWLGARLALRAEGSILHRAVFVLIRLLIAFDVAGALATVIALGDLAGGHAIRLTAIGTGQVARASVNAPLAGVILAGEFLVHRFFFCF